MDTPLTTVSFVDKHGQAKPIRLTPGGMIPFDVCESYTKSDGSQGWARAFSSSILSIMQWPNGTFKIKIFGIEFRGYPATVNLKETTQPQANGNAQVAQPAPQVDTDSVQY
jgi:hypothetical protein